MISCKVMSNGRKIALLCLDPVAVHRERQPFNYAIRRVQAHLLQSNLDGLDVHLVESRSPNVDEFVARIEELNPDVIGASVYVWSFPTLLDVVARVKQRRPDTVVVFGGPSARPSMFARAPFFDRRFDVDALVLGEGEEVFVQIAGLKDRSRAALANVAGLAIPTSDGWHRTKTASAIEDLNALTSPYALGLTQPDIAAHIESFRGCPLSCSFCQWGDMGKSSRVFSQEYLARDFEIMRAMDLKVGSVVDAALNLNPRAFRNLAAAARETGITKTMTLCFEVYPSHLTDEHVAFLSECSAGVEIGLGLQSYDKDVLRLLQRPFDEHRFEHVAQLLSDAGCNVAIEIIMGLPGDNPASFLRTLDRAQNLPCEVRVFHCLVLPDALMDRAPSWADMKFDPVTLKMQSCAGWSQQDIRDMVKRLDSMQRFETFGETAWPWQLPSRVSTPKLPRTWQVDQSAPEPVDQQPATKPITRTKPSPRLAAAIGMATNNRWSVFEAEHVEGRILLKIEGDNDGLVIELASEDTVSAAYRVVDGIAVSYRCRSPIGRESLALLTQLIDACRDEFRELVLRKGSSVEGSGAQPSPRTLPILPTRS